MAAVYSLVFGILTGTRLYKILWFFSADLLSNFNLSAVAGAVQKNRFLMLLLLDEVNPEAAAKSKKIISRSPPESRDLGKRHPETGCLPQTFRF